MTDRRNKSKDLSKKRAPYGSGHSSPATSDCSRCSPGRVLHGKRIETRQSSRIGAYPESIKCRNSETTGRQTLQIKKFPENTCTCLNGNENSLSPGIKTFGWLGPL